MTPSGCVLGGDVGAAPESASRRRATAKCPIHGHPLAGCFRPTLCAVARGRAPELTLGSGHTRLGGFGSPPRTTDDDQPLHTFLAAGGTPSNGRPREGESRSFSPISALRSGEPGVFSPPGVPVGGVGGVCSVHAPSSDAELNPDPRQVPAPRSERFLGGRRLSGVSAFQSSGYRVGCPRPGPHGSRGQSRGRAGVPRKGPVAPLRGAPRFAPLR